MRSKANLKTLVVAIDGPAGAGKSTIAKLLAKELGVSYLDTGAMYRALALKALRLKLDLENEDALVEMAKKTAVDVVGEGADIRILLDGEDVSKEIRTMEVTNNTVYMARAPRIREIMVECQRRIAGKKGVVADGRDIGTVVFPKADFKFYMDATIEERTRRRMKDLKEAGKTMDPKLLTEEIIRRDNSDKNRSVGPLRQAEDAIYLDASDFGPEETVAWMLEKINNG
jgi:cytidylate kinase